MAEGKGFGNRLQGFQIAALLAAKTGRTLIAQPFLDDVQSAAGSRLPYTQFLQPVDPAVLRVVERHEVDVDSLSQAVLPLAPSVCGRKLDWVISRCQDSDADVLVYGHHFGYLESIFRRQDLAGVLEPVHQLVRLRPEIEVAARRLRSLLPPVYDGLHLRLGDREGFALVNCTDLGLEWEEGQYGCATKQYPENLTRVHFPRQRDLYVATNLPNDSRMEDLRRIVRDRGFSLWTFDDFPSSVRDRIVAEDRGRFHAEMVAANQLGAGYAKSELLAKARADMEAVAKQRSGFLISITEQLIMIGADSYLPSWPSTWDAFVVAARARQRDSRGFELMLWELDRRCAWAKEMKASGFAKAVGWSGL